MPIGGGSLISGIATTVEDRSPATRVGGGQAAGAATVNESLTKGEPQSREDVQTIAAGIATGGISALLYELIDAYVDTVVTVSDVEIT